MSPAPFFSYFGDFSFYGADMATLPEGNEYYFIALDRGALLNPEIGRLSSFDRNTDNNENGGRIVAAMLNTLYEKTKDSFDDLDYSVVGTSVTPGRIIFRSSQGENIPYDTYDFNFLVRVPTSSSQAMSLLPDPDEI